MQREGDVFFLQRLRQCVVAALAGVGALVRFHEAEFGGLWDVLGGGCDCSGGG